MHRAILRFSRAQLKPRTQGIGDHYHAYLGDLIELDFQNFDYLTSVGWIQCAEKAAQTSDARGDSNIPSSRDDLSAHTGLQLSVTGLLLIV